MDPYLPAYWAAIATDLQQSETRALTAWRPCPPCLTAGYNPTINPNTNKPYGWPNGHRHARPDQLPPPGYDWLSWFAMAGRGWGKTRSAAEILVERLINIPKGRGFILSPRLEDARSVAADGESGLIPALERHGITIGLGRGQAKFNRQTVELFLPNKSYIKGFGGYEPASAEAFRGPQWHIGWVDEPGSIRYGLQCLEMAMLGLRLTDTTDTVKPQLIITGTPRRVGLVRQRVALHKKDPARHLIVNGRTRDNAANLADTFLEQVTTQYGGTALGQQELDGILLDDVEGAFWRHTQLDDHRAPDHLLPTFDRVVVAVDPAAGGEDEAGIIVLGQAPDRTVFVLDDQSMRGLPSLWMRTVICAASKYLYPTSRGVQVVMEANLTPQVMIEAFTLACEQAIREGLIDQPIPLKLVHAAEGKATRAEPASMLYETLPGQRPRVRHTGTVNELLDGTRVLDGAVLSALEDEMCTWVPGESKGSPNRVDALVWGLSELCFGGQSGTAALRQLGPQPRPPVEPRRGGIKTKAL